jgi:hypothetical protein
MARFVVRGFILMGADVLMVHIWQGFREGELGPQLVFLELPVFSFQPHLIIVITADHALVGNRGNSA